jgi:hypothetical protein
MIEEIYRILMHTVEQPKWGNDMQKETTVIGDFMRYYLRVEIRGYHPPEHVHGPMARTLTLVAFLSASGGMWRTPSSHHAVLES